MVESGKFGKGHIISVVIFLEYDGLNLLLPL